MINSDNIWVLWAIIMGITAISIYLEQTYSFAAKISGAIIALIFALIFSNFGVIPTESPVYDTVWNYIVPLAIPLLLFQCNLIQIYKQSQRLIVIFILSSFGTCLGSVIGYYLLHNYIPSLNYIAGAMTASYIGGGVNFVAVSTSFKIDPRLVSATIVSDNLLMVIYFLTLIIIPSIPFFNKHFKRDYTNNEKSSINSQNESKSLISLKDLAISFAATVIIVTISFNISKLVLDNFSGNIALFLGNKYLVLTTISVLCATIFSRFFSNINGTQEIGTFLIYIFFVVIGIPASIKSILQNSPLLLVFCLIIVLINMIITFIFAKIFKFSLEEAILVSNANIGGPTTAVAMAMSKGWKKFVAPVMLVGTLGYVIGNYVGLFIGYNLI